MTKPIKMACAPREDSDQPGQCPVWSESLLSARRKLASLATLWMNSEDSDQTGWMPRLIWVFAGHTFILSVLSWGGSDELWALRRLRSAWVSTQFDQSLLCPGWSESSQVILLVSPSWRKFRYISAIYTCEKLKFGFWYQTAFQEDNMSEL